MNLEIRQTRALPVTAPLDRRSGEPVRKDAAISLIRAVGDVGCPLLVTSDLHDKAELVIGELFDFLGDLGRWTWLSAGDMAGTGVLGSNGDALPALRAARSFFDRVYFVQGNHDLPNDEARGMRNKDGTRCHLAGRVQEIDGLGWVGGVDGILSDHRRGPHRYPEVEYLDKIGLAASGADWLVTHDAPLVPELTESTYGRQSLRDAVLSHGVKRHVFGHCHFDPWYGAIGDTTFMCVDARVVCVEPR